jgi:hypothetical protein
MHVRRLAAGLLACVTFAACSDNSTTAPTAPSNTDIPALARAHTGPLLTQLTNVAVIGAANNVNPAVRGLAGTFTGTAAITSFASNAAGQLLANGTITGTATFVTALGQTITQTVSQAFTNLLVTPAAANCRILHLDLGPIFLDLLGLQLTTSEIVVDLTAVPGAGNLLGNLLCALVHLLDQNPLLPAIQNLLAQINGILATL